MSVRSTLGFDHARFAPKLTRRRCCRESAPASTRVLQRESLLPVQRRPFAASRAQGPPGPPTLVFFPSLLLLLLMLLLILLLMLLLMLLLILMSRTLPLPLLASPLASPSPLESRPRHRTSLASATAAAAAA